ncbi:MAG: hypothetical protein KY476_10050 [Planctomycetes bacterium]|nr:hypothetical protein [Planctomycetota bacterium]
MLLDTGTVDRRQIQDIILKSPRLSPALLRKLDRGMEECCRRTKVSYGSVSYGEEIYKQTSWKTLGTALQPDASQADAEGDLDCRELRFDGLYRDDSSAPATYLRFYSDGEFAAAVTDDTPRDVARWLRREGRWISVGKYTVSGSTLTGEYQVPSPPDEEPVVIKLKGRLTRKGLQVREWSSYSRKESRQVYVFHELSLK